MSRNDQNHTSAKCFVCMFGTFVFIFLALLVFGLIVIQVKTPILQIDSIVVKSLEYDLYPHLYLNLTMQMSVSFKNRAYGHVQFNGNKTMELHYGNASVIGLTELELGKRVESRGKKVIEFKINASSNNSSKGGVKGLHQVDEFKLNNDIYSGYLELYGKASIKTRVYLIKNKIIRETEAPMNCDIVINLWKKTVERLICY